MPFLANLRKKIFFVSAENIPVLIAGLAICLASTDSMAGKDRERRPVSLPACLDQLTLGHREDDPGRADSSLSGTDDISQGAWSQDSLQALAKFLSGKVAELQQGGRAKSSEAVAGKTIADETLADETTTQKAEPILDRSSFSQELDNVRKFAGLAGSNIAMASRLLNQPDKYWRWQPSESGKYAIPFTMSLSTRGTLWQPGPDELNSISEPLVALISKDGILILGNKVEMSPVLVELRILCRAVKTGKAYILYTSDRPEWFGRIADVDKWSKEICPVYAGQKDLQKIVAKYLPSLFWAFGKHNAEGVLSMTSSQAHSFGCGKGLALKQKDSSRVLMIDCYFEDAGITVILRSHFDKKLVKNKLDLADVTSALQLTYRFISGSDGVIELRCVYFHFHTDYRSSGVSKLKEKTRWRSPSHPSSGAACNLERAQSTSILDQLHVSENWVVPWQVFRVPLYLKQQSESADMILDLWSRRQRCCTTRKRIRFISFAMDPYEIGYVATNCDDMACDDIERCQLALDQENYELLMQLTLQSGECMESRLTEFGEWYRNNVALPAKAATRLEVTSDSFEQDLHKAMNEAELTFQNAKDFCPRVVFHPGTLSFSDYMELQKVLTDYIHFREGAEKDYLETKRLMQAVSDRQCLNEDDLIALVQIVVNVVDAEHTFRSRASPLGGKARELEIRLKDGALFVPHDYQRHLLLYYHSLIGQILNLIAVKGQVSMENVSRILQLYEEHMGSGNQYRIVRKIRSALSLPNNNIDRTFQDLRKELSIWQLYKDTHPVGLKWFIACMSGAHTDLTD